MKKLLITLPVLLLVSVPAVVFAETLNNPLKVTTLTDFLVNLLHLVSLIAFPILVLFIVYIGFLFVSSEGNPEKLKTAKAYFFWALVGGLLVLAGEALALAIQATVKALGA